MIGRMARGALAGTVATAAMSGLMLAGARAGLMREQPPKRVVRALLPGHRHRPKPGERTLGTLAHFAFGAASGALFGLLAGGRRPRVPAGVAYALAIWVSGYQGWIPEFKIMPPISQDLPGRPAVMAAAHVVYGTALVLVLNRISPEPRRGLPPAPPPSDRVPAPAGAAGRAR